jgi:hypothetical protein
MGVTVLLTATCVHTRRDSNPQPTDLKAQSGPFISYMWRMNYIQPTHMVVNLT